LFGDRRRVDISLLQATAVHTIPVQLSWGFRRTSNVNIKVTTGPHEVSPAPLGTAEQANFKKLKVQDVRVAVDISAVLTMTLAGRRCRNSFHHGF
jgi:hypothetical protein